MSSFLIRQEIFGIARTSELQTLKVTLTAKATATITVTVTLQVSQRIYNIISYVPTKKQVKHRDDTSTSEPYMALRNVPCQAVKASSGSSETNDLSRMITDPLPG
jgi:hypothetical protein